MTEDTKKDIENLFKDKAFLTIEDVGILLNCDIKVIYNWTKRPDPSRRPPKIIVGKSIRFPKTEFLNWLASEWSREV